MKTIHKFLQSFCCAIILIVITGITSTAQETIEVKNIDALMSKGSKICYVVTIPQADLDIVEQNWIKRLQEDIKTRVKIVNQELILTHVVKSELSADTLNIYSLLIQKEEGKITLNVFVEIGDVFFGPKEDKTDLLSDKTDNSIKNYVRSFAVEQYKIAVANELEGEQKVLETMQNDLEKLEKDNDNLNKDISSLENDIDKAEREIKDLEASIDLKNKEILTHSASMGTITLDADKKIALDKQKSLEKEKNRLEKDRSNAKEDISSCNSKIEKDNDEIEDNSIHQEELKVEIAKQNEVVKQVQAKLDGIK